MTLTVAVAVARTHAQLLQKTIQTLFNSFAFALFFALFSSLFPVLFSTLLFSLSSINSVAQTPNRVATQGISAASCDIASGCFAATPLLNADFENGNTGFTTLYNPNNFTGICTPGANCNGQYLCGQGYAVGNSATPCNPTWSTNIHDHTTGVGKMMLVDFPANGSIDIWCQSVNLTPGADYCFGAYFINLMPLGNTTGEPSFQYMLNNTLIDVTPTIHATEQWEFSGFQFNSGAGGNVTLCIQNANAGAIGFDAAIDDISLREMIAGTPPNLANDNLVLCTNNSTSTVAVLANDAAGSGVLDNTTLRIMQQPPFSQGAVSVNQAAGTVTFTAGAGFTSPTSFDYQICNTNGCCATATVNVTRSTPIPVTLSAAPSANVCANSIVTLIATSITGTYQWSAGATATVAGSATAIPSPIAPATTATYTVTATDANNCSVVRSIVIATTPATPTAVGVTASANPICSGTSVTFTASPFGGGANPSYQWLVNGTNTGVNSPTFVTSVLNNTDVVGVLMTSSAVCANTAIGSVQMQVMPIVVPTLDVTLNATTFCTGDNVEFTANTTNAGATPVYTWYINGVSMLTGTNQLASTLFNNGDLIYVDFQSSAACAQPALLTSAPIAVVIYPITTPSLSITPPPVLCQGAPATFTAVATGVSSTPTYQWQVNAINAGSNSPIFTSNTLISNDVVSCTITSASACSSGIASAQTTVTVLPNVTPSITLTTPITTICNGSFAVFTTNIVANGGANPTYNWLVNGAPQTAATNVFSTSTLQTGANVQVVMTSNAACAVNNPVTASVSMTVLPNIVPTMTVHSLTNQACSGQTAFFNTTITNGGTTPTYQWKVNGANVGANSPNFNSTTLNNGDAVSCYLTSSLNCATNPAIGNVIMAITPSVTPTVIITPSATAACTGQNFDFVATGVFPGPTPSYVWSVNGVQVFVGNVFSSSQLNNNDNISVTMTTSAVCPTTPTATANQSIQVQTLSPAINLIHPDTCKQGIGRALALPNGTATGVTYTYAWSNSETADTAKILLGNKRYVVTITDNLGCYDTVSIFIPLVSGVKIDRMETTSAFCGIDGQLLDGTAAPVFNNPRLPHTYEWFDEVGGALPVTDSLAALPAGKYIVVVTDRSGCTTTSTAIVPPPIFPNVIIAASDREIMLGDSVSLVTHASSNDILTYQWSPIPSYCIPCKGIQVAPIVSTIYSVTVTNLANCTATATVDIEVLTNYELYIPNIFTPNNDGLNDNFLIQSSANVSKILQLRIFDRWGEVVYLQNNTQTNDPKTSWDGTFKTKKAPLGVYFYHLIVEYVDGKQRTYTGDVTILE